MAKPHTTTVPSYSQIACVGTGMSAIALGATLKRWYQMDDIKFFERHGDCGGTWYINSYPGCACDVPSALYSFSFAPNKGWTKINPSRQEIKAYLDRVIEEYGLREKMTFRTEVRQCIWREDASRWLITLYNLDSKMEYHHECQVLFAASGQLVECRPCDIPGASSFNGAMFHSARWNHSVDLKKKKIVVLGNGCSAAQIVPAIVEETESLTQIVRTKHWLFEAPKFVYPRILRWIFQYVPLTLTLHRWHIFLIVENDLRLFYMTKAAARLRQKKQQDAERYMRETAPARYHDILIPDFDVGCKRRILDPGYLESLHNDKLRLTNAEITEIVPDGVKTTEGIVPADAIVLATGFQTSLFAPYMDVHGKNSTIKEHWEKYDGPGAYNCSALSGFPNFFLLLGPNSATGHTSSLIAAENSINYALRVLKPVLSGDAASIEIKPEAEEEYIYKVQDALRQRVWNGCTSNYLNDKKWNAMAYPWSQAHYWYRSMFPTWSHWKIKTVQKPVESKTGRIWLFSLLTVLGCVLVLQPQPLWSAFATWLKS